jgi:hypothetical protein
VPGNYPAFFESVEASWISSAIRQSSWLYPFIEIIHIFGIVLVAGGAVLFDLKLLSSGRSPFIEESRHLLSWSKRGLIIAIPSGLLLFATNATALSQDPVFGMKLFLLILAAINAWIFHLRVYLPYKEANREFQITTAKFNAIFSIILWMSIISCGRLLAY